MVSLGLANADHFVVENVSVDVNSSALVRVVDQLVVLDVAEVHVVGRLD